MQSSRQEHQTFARSIQANTCSKLMATVINMSSCLPFDKYVFKVVVVTVEGELCSKLTIKT